MIVLTLKDQPPVPLEAEILSPDHFAGLDSAAIRALPVFLGKRQLRDTLDEFGVVQSTGKIFFGVQAATRPQRRDHVGRNEALIEGLGAVARDRS